MEHALKDNVYVLIIILEVIALKVFVILIAQIVVLVIKIQHVNVKLDIQGNFVPKHIATT